MGVTEAEWLACSDPTPMVELLRDKAGERKLRLCAAAWARSFMRRAEQAATPRIVQYQGWLADPHWIAQLDAAELFADGVIDRKGLRATRQSSGGPWNLYLAATRVSHFSINEVYLALQRTRGEFGGVSDHEICALVRDVFNPWRAEPIPPSWLAWHDATCHRMAQGIYAERAFDRLPILHDALLDAGCDDEAILSHSRSEGPHVRGCWVIDLILGKE
jgi:hypothetical protein